VNWASDKGGMIPDDADYSDAFTRMRLKEGDPDREPFTPAELRTIFGCPVYMEGARPEGGKGEAAFWLPLMAVLNGARLGDYAGLSVADIQTNEDANVPVMVLRENTRQGRTLKTKSTARTVPLHPELIRIGFLRFVESRRSDGAEAWLFPLMAPGTNGAAAFSKWFGRHLGALRPITRCCCRRAGLAGCRSAVRPLKTDHLYYARTPAGEWKMASIDQAERAPSGPKPSTLGACPGTSQRGFFMIRP
jgi:integrase